MQPWQTPLQGRLEERVFESEALKNNPLNDPHQRPLWVYLPPEYERASSEPFTTLYVIQGLTGQVDMWRNRHPMRRTPIEDADALFASGEVPPCIVVWVDCWTSLGGSQYLDSPGTGQYHTYLCDEIVPFIDREYRSFGTRERRGIAGKSSGGYGAMVTPLLRPDLWGGLATHAGDALFEACYLPEFRQAARALRDHYGGSYEAFWNSFRARPAFSKKEDAVLLNAWCMAACYSTDPDGTVRIPFDPLTAELLPHVWERWLAWDPVRMVPQHAETVRGLQAIYIDAGKRDEYYLDLGAEAYRRAVEATGAVGVAFELFDATHQSIAYRYPLGLKFLAERLTG